jgi:hypothetical protein
MASASAAGLPMCWVSSQPRPVRQAIRYRDTRRRRAKCAQNLGCGIRIGFGRRPFFLL